MSTHGKGGGTANAVWVDDGSTRATVADIQNNRGVVCWGRYAYDGATGSKWSNGNSEEIELELGTNLLDGGDVGSRGKGGVKLESHVGAFRADRVVVIGAVDGDAGE